MPANSKSQQRLFGMVHAYNKGELHGSRALRRRIAALSKHISADDALHFAQTPHTGLPERKEKRASSPSDADLRRMYDIVQADARLFRRLQALGLVDSVRAGRRVRNRIVHQPGYIPSEADSDRALRDYDKAERQASKTEKQAQVVVRPETVQEMYDKVPVGAYASAVMRRADRSERRRSFLGHVFTGTGVGAAVGGLGAAGLGAFIARNAARNSGIDDSEMRSRMLEAAAKLGFWGAGRGAVAGSVLGAGLGLIDKIRG